MLMSESCWEGFYLKGEYIFFDFGNIELGSTNITSLEVNICYLVMEFNP